MKLGGRTPWLHANSIRKKMVWFSFSSWCDVQSSPELGVGTDEASFSFNSCAIILLATHVQHVQHLKHPQKRGRKEKQKPFLWELKKGWVIPSNIRNVNIDYKLCKNQHSIANMRRRWKYFRMEGTSFLKKTRDPILKLFLVLQKGIVGCQKVWSNLPAWTQQWSIPTMLLLHMTFSLKSKSRGLHVSHGQLQQQLV